MLSVGGISLAGYDEAAQWCLDNNYNLEDALKWEETSIQNEDRFDNWETKSRILEAMVKKEESAKALSTALDKATAAQLYFYAPTFQRQANPQPAFHFFPLVTPHDSTPLT